MPLSAKQSFHAIISRLFPRTKDIEVHVDSSKDESTVYVDVNLKHGLSIYRVSDLNNIPSRIKVGDRYFRLSKKNRHTLAQLAYLDPRFDATKGFVFPEKDVPEILNYLRQKASVEFSRNSKAIHVDQRPLQYEHQAKVVDDVLDITTALVSPDSRVRIENNDDANFTERSSYAHAKNGYYHKPIEKRFRTLPPNVGNTKLSGDQIPFFLLHDLKKIQQEPGSQIDPSIEKQRVITSEFHPRVSLKVEGPWIWFDVRYEAEKFNVPFQEMESLGASRYFLRQNETWIQADKQTHTRVSDKVAAIPEVESIDNRFRTHTYHFNEVQSLLEEVATLDLTEEYAKFKKSLEDFTQIGDHPLPDTLNGSLRIYQKNGYDWLSFLQKYGLNGILADEMGLGKTVQAIAKLLDVHGRSPGRTSLVVCPPSVLSAWEDDLKKFTSKQQFKTAEYIGSNRSRILRELQRYDAIFTTYSILTRDIGLLSKVSWEYVVLDEAQKIKNPSTATAKACKQLIAKHKLAVSGTPIENRLSELWSLYDFLMPSYLGTQSHFRDNFEIPIMRRGDRDAQEKLRKRVSPFKMRREKTLVATELPPKIPMERYCELTPEQAHLYKQYATAERNRIEELPGEKIRMDTSILAAITRLKQICCHPALVTKNSIEIYKRSGKLEAFIEIVEEILENNERALVFSQYTEMHSILRRVLAEKSIKYFYLDGSTPLKERTRLKEAYQRGEVPFFLISLQAGGVGMTLTQANCVIHYDRWWNPAVENQATDRAHRIGQTNSVKVFRIHTRGTIDERIEELQAKKSDLFNSVIEIDKIRKEVTKEELLELFASP